jgi:CubicO group peptidase (beta-lactamase class C family)
LTGGWLGLVLLVAACSRADRVTPLAPMPRLTTDWLPVISYLDSAVAAGAAPGAVLAVSHNHVRFIHGTGRLGADEPQRPGPATIYDLASLTKVVGLTTAAMLAVESGRLELDAPVQRHVPAFAGPGKENVTIRMLLAHAGGLPAWRPLYREATTRNEAFALANSTPMSSPPRTTEVYSDVGLIVLTQAIEQVYGRRLDAVLNEMVFQPLQMSSTRYAPPPAWRDRIAPTELDPWRGRVLRGEVHDENAAVLDGVSGHAGLFGSAEDLLTFAEWILDRMDGRTGGGSEHDSSSDFPIIRPSVVREFTRRQAIVSGSSRALGWDTPSPGGSAGARLSPSSFGHTGFTGTSLWIDPERRLAIVLLSNRVNPTRNNPRWHPLRAALADLIVATLYEDAR